MPAQIKLTDEDITYLLTVLRNSTHPITTQELIDVLRNRAMGSDEASAEE